jgi:hypothetical protein
MRSAFSILADLHHLATILKIQCNPYKGFVKNKVARFQEFFLKLPHLNYRFQQVTKI